MSLRRRRAAREIVDESGRKALASSVIQVDAAVTNDGDMEDTENHGAMTCKNSVHLCALSVSVVTIHAAEKRGSSNVDIYSTLAQ